MELGGAGGSVASAFLVWFLSKMEFGKRVLRGWRSRASQPSPFIPCPQLEVNLEEILGEGLLVSWAFTDRPQISA